MERFVQRVARARTSVTRGGIMHQPMKVLVGYDGLSCADAALHDLRLAGLPGVVEAVVMSVADVLRTQHTGLI
jgi:hypothetical protein